MEPLKKGPTTYSRQSVSLKALGVDTQLNYGEIRTEDNELEHRIEELFPGLRFEMLECTSTVGNTAGHKYLIFDFEYNGKRYCVKIDGRLFFVATTFKFDGGFRIENGLVTAYEKIPEKQKALLAAWLDKMRPLVEEKNAKRRNEFKSKKVNIVVNAAYAIFSMVTGIFTFFYRKVRDIIFGKKARKMEIIKGPTCVAVESAILFDVAKFDKICENKPWFPADLLKAIAGKGLCSDGVKLEPQVYIINSSIADFWNNLPRWKNMYRYILKVLKDRRTYGS
jgi:hypothetical protein